MKTIVIVRHGKAVGKKEGAPDFDRVLATAGQTVTREIAQRMRDEGLPLELFVSSPAARALETAHVVAAVVGYPVQRIRLESLLYESPFAEAFLGILQGFEDRFESVVLFGHNPTFSDLAGLLVAGFEEDIPKSGVVAVAFDVDTWKEVTAGGGRLLARLYPAGKG